MEGLEIGMTSACLYGLCLRSNGIIINSSKPQPFQLPNKLCNQNDKLTVKISNDSDQGLGIMPISANSPKTLSIDA